MMDHRFSIGFKSGLLGGQGCIRTGVRSLRNFMVSFVVSVDLMRACAVLLEDPFLH